MPTRLAPTILTSAKSHTVPPTARAHGTSHALAQKLQRSQAPLGFEISLGRSTGSPKKNGFDAADKEQGGKLYRRSESLDFKFR